jgi:hypothetical protein
MRPYDARHKMATLLLLQRTPTKVVSASLGHASTGRHNGGRLFARLRVAVRPSDRRPGAGHSRGEKGMIFRRSRTIHAPRCARMFDKALGADCYSVCN